MKGWNACVHRGLLIILGIASAAWSQQDPGPRPGPAASGGPYSTLNATGQTFFSQAFLRFGEVRSVSERLKRVVA